MAGPPSPLTRAVTESLRQLLAAEPDEKRLNAALRQLAKWRSRLVANRLVARSGDQVLSGPFAGMNYSLGASEGSQAARLLGGYEASLAPVFEEIISGGYEQIIDIGSAEGYVAVGLARRMPGVRILARDNDPRARAMCAELARRNFVADRVEIGGIFAHADFDRCLGAETAIVCDVEGAEDALLDPLKAPGLRAADILVEVHDCFAPGLSDRIAARFAATHKITRIGRTVAGNILPPWMEELGDLDRLIALWEWRVGPTPWLWMVRT